MFAAVAALIPAREAAPLARLDAQRALELDPELPEAAENLEQQRGALREDPLNLRYLNAAANALARLGRLDEAEAECQKILEIDAGHSLAYATVASIEAARGHWPEALAAMRKAHSTTSFNLLIQGALAGLLLRNGDSSGGQEQLRHLGDGSAYGATMGFVLAYLYAGETDLAIAWMLKAIDQRYPIPLHSVTGPSNLLRSSPLWPQVARLMNLPDVVWNKSTA